ncbi:sulfate transporter family-domain-containing protein [Mycena galopus ATCC 62051]|nr:sulfate transporter family-domain-containing protein [Mycena galopus ATCC 62051]
MDIFKLRSSKFISTLPIRLYRSLPAVILGFLFNILDSVSIGILLFPATDGAFRRLQLQGLSMFIMSTLASQVAMTLGGSRFPGALGAMLMEILPFLRGVASDIRGALGDDHPGLIPTVMAAYALTSFLTGCAFFVLGLLRLGTVVAYFPQTVLTGAIGAIGVSLFVLGLGLPFPSTATPLSLENAASTLFAKSHLGLLAASFFPAFVLSVTLRSRRLELWTRSLTRSAYYIPIYLLCIPGVFWVVVASLHVSKDHLVATGWLFTVDSTATSSGGIVSSWNYWTLFNFKLVEWRSLNSAVQNIVLLVVIGVLNLPIFVPSLAFSLDVAYDMNHELLGQGAANILAGIFGTVPNILQFSYSVYVTRANGGRFELCLIILLTGVLFLCAGSLLPYIPTILASAMVLFLGIELFLGATWEASGSLTAMELAVAIGTLVACTFLGFAEGFGVGIGVAAVVYLMYGFVDSPAKKERWTEWRDVQQEKNDPVVVSEARASTTRAVEEESSDSLHSMNAYVVILSGYIFFASIPSMEKEFFESKVTAELIILDLTRAHRIETAAARCITRCVRELELKQRTLVICGLTRNSGLHADFARAEVPLAFDVGEKVGEKEIRVFATRISTCGTCLLTGHGVEMDSQAMESAFRKFCHLFDFNLSDVLGNSIDGHPHATPSSNLDRFVQNGGHITALRPGEALHAGVTFVVDGQITLVNSTRTPDPEIPGTRPSFRNLLAMIPRQTVHALGVPFSGCFRRWPRHTWRSGDVLDLRSGSKFGVSVTQSVVVQIEGETLSAWAQMRCEGFITAA